MDQLESAGVEPRGTDVRLQDTEPGEGVGGEEPYVAVDREHGRDTRLVQQPPGDGAGAGSYVEAVPARPDPQAPQPGHRGVVVGERAEVDAVVLPGCSGRNTASP